MTSAAFFQNMSTFTGDQSTQSDALSTRLTTSSGPKVSPIASLVHLQNVSLATYDDEDT
jgi:hypothetical protein